MTTNRVWLPVFVVLLVAIPVTLTGLMLGVPVASGIPAELAGVGWASLGLTLGVLVWKILDYTLLRAVRRLAVEVAAATHGGTGGRTIDPDRYAFLPVLPQAMLELAGKLAQARTGVEAAVRAKTEELEMERARLAAIIDELHEGVVVCNADHRLVLYNRAAFEMLGASERMGLGRLFLGLVAAEPVLHALELLHRRGMSGSTVPFVAGTPDGTTLLQGRLSLVKTGQEKHEFPSGYAVALSDRTDILRTLAERDRLIARLASAVGERIPAHLADDILTIQSGAAFGWWPMGDLFSSDLFEFLRRRLVESGPELTEIGLPAWFRGDSHMLILLLESFVRTLAAAAPAACFDISAAPARCPGGVKIDWSGPLPSDDVLMNWLTVGLGLSVGGMTAGEVLSCHGTAGPPMVYRDDAGSHAELRLRAAQLSMPSSARLPKRPEFFDFSLLSVTPPPSMADRLLRELQFVVFDTETTGLSPSQGDRVVSLAGVRVVNGRILTGEAFERMVDPQRPIPPESVKFHGITEHMIKGKPPLAVVLPQFHAFAADAVLVAHNAAFDLTFLRMSEAEASVVFDNPVLDTMLLSAFVDGTAEAQSLDDIAGRYGVPVAERHTALGDSLITAAILVRLFDALEAKGVRTLGEVLANLDMTMQIHNRALTLR